MNEITYKRLDGTTFQAPIFHPRMEHAGVVDPLDGVIKVFETVFDEAGRPVLRRQLRGGPDGLQE